MSAGGVVYRALVCRRSYKARVPYVGRDRMVALTLAQAYIARGFKTILGCSIHNQAAISLYTKLGFAVTAQAMIHDGYRSTKKKYVHA